MGDNIRLNFLTMHLANMDPKAMATSITNNWTHISKGNWTCQEEGHWVLNKPKKIMTPTISCITTSNQYNYLPTEEMTTAPLLTTLRQQTMVTTPKAPQVTVECICLGY